jgi:AraC-like DNA-binding protein
MGSAIKRKDGFEGEKLISVPPKVWKDHLKKFPELFRIYITHIGYFPKASFHYRERKTGCDDNILIYCLQGKGFYVIDNKRFEVKPNQFFLLPATNEYIRYWADNEDPWTIYWVHFTGSIIENFNTSLDINIFKGPVQIPFNAKALEIWNNIYQSLEMGYSIENLCNASFCLYHLIAAFLFYDQHIEPKKEEPDDIITLAIMYMKTNLSQKLTVENMAAQHQLSTSHFSNLFRKATGMPPIDYFIHLKMQKACQLLYLNETKIRLVAQDLGYEDQYYFSRLFKKYMGLSPEQYKHTANKTLAAAD